MSEKFRITGPGWYALRNDKENWGPAVITKRTAQEGYDWEGHFVNGPSQGLETWTDSGKFNRHESSHTALDIVARLPDEPPMPDAQDRIVGVETTPNPVDPLTRLEAWRSADVENRRYVIHHGHVELFEGEWITISVLTSPRRPTMQDAITKALDIAEGVKP